MKLKKEYFIPLYGMDVFMEDINMYKPSKEEKLLLLRFAYYHVISTLALFFIIVGSILPNHL